MKNRNLRRMSEWAMTLVNEFGLSVKIFANQDVHVEDVAVQELKELLELQRTVERLKKEAPGFLPQDASIVQVAVTPDFHKGAGIPIGTVLATKGFMVPQAIGNDVNCGMRVYVTELNYNEIVDHLDELETAFRHAFFQGGRDIPMNHTMREALLKEGLMGLMSTVPRGFTSGLWEYFHQAVDQGELERVHQYGSFLAKDVMGFKSYLGTDELSRGSQIGSIGGGNHFVEIQRVSEIIDGQTAYAWGFRPDQVAIMIHSGSVNVGEQAGWMVKELLTDIWPKKVRKPANGIFVLPDTEQVHCVRDKVHDLIYNAANFAFANRMFLGLMVQDVLRRVIRESALNLVYDAPHNMFWPRKLDSGIVMLHRKGACPSNDSSMMMGTSFQYYGEPVIVPGSMGSSSYVMRGLGNSEALFSASHGAGRALSRGKALKHDPAAFERFLQEFRVVLPLDFRKAEVKKRPDIIKRKLDELKQEAPFAYKGIGPVVRTLQGAEIAEPVVELHPILTIKG